MKSKNIGQVSDQIDSLIETLGLTKMSADPGTTHPAKQDQDKSNISAATTGEQSAENTRNQKKEVPGKSTAEASADEAANKGAESSTENTTTAEMADDGPPSEGDYGSRQQTLDAPGTSHPADVNKDPEKFSSQLRDSANFIDNELAKMAESTEDSGQTPTVGDRIGELLLGKEASSDEKDQAVHKSVEDYLGGYTKTASIIGELTADYLDILQKQGMDGVDPAAMGSAEAAAGAPAGGASPEMMEGGAGAMEEGGDDEAIALAQAAEMIAAELGVTPEEVLMAAEQELAGMGGEAAMGAAAPAEEAEAEAGGAAEATLEDNAEETEETEETEESGPQSDEDEEEKMAVARAELDELYKKAAELDQIKAAHTQAEQEERLKSMVSDAVSDTLRRLATEESK
jgi:hypothetical protein